MSEYLPEPETDEERLIRLSIDNAAELDLPITDQAVRLIAGLIHGGQATAMYSLASCGAINMHGLEREVVLDYNDPSTVEPQISWLAAIAGYAGAHGDRGPVEGWYRLTTDAAVAERLQMFDELGDL